MILVNTRNIHKTILVYLSGSLPLFGIVSIAIYPRQRDVVPVNIAQKHGKLNPALNKGALHVVTRFSALTGREIVGGWGGIIQYLILEHIRKTDNKHDHLIKISKFIYYGYL